MMMRDNMTKDHENSGKLDRREDILATAHKILAEVGFDGLTMSMLSARTGFSKGTLYSYVETKQELFAELYVDALRIYLTQVMPHAAMDTALTAEMLIAAKDVPLFLQLLARQTTEIEHRLPRESLIAIKRAIAEQEERFAARLVKTRGLNNRTAIELAQALFVALQGASHMAAECPKDFSGMPDDVKAIYALSDFDEAFARTATMILRGASIGTNLS
ncbi:MAG: AcrR family transcriptional regulator [Celeribacter sp.]|jgi:AcrR family transcriptional regulator